MSRSTIIVSDYIFSNLLLPIPSPSSGLYLFNCFYKIAIWSNLVNMIQKIKLRSLICKKLPPLISFFQITFQVYPKKKQIFFFLFTNVASQRHLRICKSYQGNSFLKVFSQVIFLTINLNRNNNNNKTGNIVKQVLLCRRI